MALPAAMISSVTTTTVVTLVSLPGAATAMGLLAVLALLSFLVTKELASAGEDTRLLRLAKQLNIAIVPLLLVFVGIVLAHIAAAF
jgi:hypothetical protein